jgi:glucose 1-dehydrogenase
MLLSSDFPNDLRGRRAVVTGAASGIGYAIASRLAQAGAKVVALDKNKERLSIREQHDWAGLEIQTVTADFASNHDDSDMAALAESLLHGGGAIELIVNNVGVCTATSFLETTREQFDLVMRTNLSNPWFFTRRLVEALIAAERPGSVLFISSLHEQFVSHRPQYSMSKAAVAMGVRELAVALSEFGIRVNTISPGWIDTAPTETRHRDRRKAARMKRYIPLGRPGDPDDVAKVALFLLSDDWSSYITGVDLPVDGGLSLHSWARRPPNGAAH